MSADTITTAVQRAAEAIEAEIKAHPTFDPRPFGAIGTFPLGATMHELARAALASLDVEEIAAAIDPRAFGPMTRRSSFARYLGAQHAARRKATAVRAALLGDEQGEADPGLLLIVLGVLVTVLLGAGVVAAALGVLG